MSRSFFIQEYKHLVNDIMGKRWTDEFFGNAATMLKADGMDDAILTDIFKQQSTYSPAKFELSPNDLRNKYWDVVRDNTRENTPIETLQTPNRIDGEVGKFVGRFYRWSRNKTFINEDQYKKFCKYDLMEQWQKELIDEYIAGRLKKEYPLWVSNPD